MRRAITISIPPKLSSELDKFVNDEGISRSDVLRECLRDYLFIQKLRALRKRMLPKAQKKGIFVDEDVFRRVS